MAHIVVPGAAIGGAVMACEGKDELRPEDRVTVVAFVAQPQIPPRNVNWSSSGKWVHLAKAGFEKYFIRKLRKGTSEPFYEHLALKALGIEKLNQTTKG